MSNKRRVRVDDFCELRQVSAPHVSPDGSRVAFSVTDPICAENRYITQLFLADLYGNVRQLTNAGTDNREPVWSPSGREIAFLSNADGTSSLWKITPDQGIRKKMVSVGENLSPPIWSPDSRRILFLSRVLQGPPKQSDVIVIRTLPYKFDGLGFLNDKWNHLFVVDENGANLQQLTEGEYNIMAAAWLPDGSKIAYLAGKGEHREFSYRNDVWITDLKKATHERLTDSTRYFHSLSFSPDGRHLAYIARTWKYGLASKTDTYARDLETNKEVNLTAEFNSKIGDTISGGTSFVVDPSPVWSSSSDSIFFLTTVGGNADLYKVEVDSHKVSIVTDTTRTIQSYSFSQDGKVMAFLATDIVDPSEIWISKEGYARKLTKFNDGLIEQLELSKGTKFTFTASDNVPIDGWFYPPVDSTRSPYPMVLILKGGPHTWCYGNAFSFQAQLLAAEGFATLYTNERGSGGYGEEFARTARAKFYGEREFQDIMEAVDYVLGIFDVDKERLGITGYSRGGFLTNWTITHTDRFKAAVTAGGISDFYSFYGIGDEMHIWCEENFEGTLWDSEELYRAKSPLRYVKNVKTPAMIIHAQQDYRSSVTQAEELYVALKSLGKEAELIIFPNENHGLPRTSAPLHLIEYHQHVIRWFRKYLS